MWLCWSNCVIGRVISSCHNDESVQHAHPTCHYRGLSSYFQLSLELGKHRIIVSAAKPFSSSIQHPPTSSKFDASHRLLSMTAPPERVVGVVYVVDSSLTLASEWSTVLKDYISHLLQRIMALYHPAQVCQRSFRLWHYSTCWLRFAPRIYRYVLR